VVIFNDRVGDVAERYLHKGSKIYVEGSLQTRKWTDQSGQERYSTEVVIGRFKGELTMLDTRGGGGEGTGDGGGYRSERPMPQRSTGGAPRGGGPTWEAPKGGDLDDEIPF